jgi:hypothetical protein
MILVNLIHLNMYNLIAQVFRRILTILISLPLTLRLTTHLTQCRSRRLMTLTYFREISRHTLSWWVRWPSIWVLVPLVPNMRLLTRRRIIPSSCSSECLRRKHLPTQGTGALTVKFDQETHIARSLTRRIFRRHWCIFFNFRDYNLYFILFERLHVIFFIYDLKFSFSYLWFEIKFLQTFKILIIKHTLNN